MLKNQLKSNTLYITSYIILNKSMEHHILLICLDKKNH